jgi:hypothetical protein
MTTRNGNADRLAKALAIVLGTEEVPLRLRAWDGSEAGPEGAPVLEFRSRRACGGSCGLPASLASAARTSRVTSIPPGISLLPSRR